MRIDRRAALAACLAMLAGLAAPAQAAQAYPVKPVRILVGSPPGGGTDILARMLAEQFGRDLGQSVVVENRPGASNTIAADMTARADPDGHTLLVATTTGQAIAPHLLKLKFDPLTDLQPIGMVAVMPNVLVVSASGPYRSVTELLAAMRAQPEGLRYGSSGVGSTQHVGGVAFTAATGTQAVHVPYKGSSQAQVDMLGGQIEMMFDTTSSAMPQIRAGKLRPLAVSAPARIAELPDVPTLAESGVQGADVATWYGLYATAGTPPAVVERLGAALEQVLSTPQTRQRIQALGGEIRPMSPTQFGQFNKAEFERYGKLVASVGLAPQ
ncbi:tripartite tricarboxylate transporter substrate binding protein [Orrella sp. JC864]|uniref:Bug family tripartite tricarboxylate transporter substrate binding protein n=1 Tax=Orrella sp. JC864 TaxID=3120298 RepID=UPI00300A1E3F